MRLAEFVLRAQSCKFCRIWGESLAAFGWNQSPRPNPIPQAPKCEPNARMRLEAMSHENKKLLGNSGLPKAPCTFIVDT